MTVQCPDNGQADGTQVGAQILECLLHGRLAAAGVLAQLAHESLETLVRALLALLVRSAPLGIGVAALLIGSAAFLPVLLAIRAHFQPQIAHFAEDRARAGIEAASVGCVGHGSNLSTRTPTVNVLILIQRPAARSLRRA